MARTWPHREASQFIGAGGLRWHLQRFACTVAGWLQAHHRVILLLHAHRRIDPLLARPGTLAARYAEVLSPDLPGSRLYGGTGRRNQWRDPVAAWHGAGTASCWGNWH